VDDGVYNVLAYIENSNLNATAGNLNYIFKLYDKQGILLKERRGQTFVPANKVMAVFEPELLTGNQVPQRVDFSFSSEAVWVRQESAENNLSITQSTVSRDDSAPRLSTVITNRSINPVKQTEAIAIVYNQAGNTIAFSRTIVDALQGKESRILNFNWPKPFSEQYARTEIVLKVLK
jgi:hypothetical protein